MDDILPVLTVDFLFELIPDTGAFALLSCLSIECGSYTTLCLSRNHATLSAPPTCPLQTLPTSVLSLFLSHAHSQASN